MASRRATGRRHEPPAESRADSASVRTGRPVRRGDASNRSSNSSTAWRSVVSSPTGSGNSIHWRIGSGGMRGATYDSSSPRASRQPAIPSGPKRSATAGSGSAARAPAVRMPSASSSPLRSSSSPSRPIAIRPMNPATPSASTIRGRPGRARIAAAWAVKRPGPEPTRPPAGRHASAACSNRPMPPCMRTSPSARSNARPGVSGSTAAPIPSNPTSIASAASATAPGSAATSEIRGQRAIASPARMPGRTPNVAAAAFTSPIRERPPASGASAAGSSPAAPPIATRRAKRGTSAQIRVREAGGIWATKHRRTGVRLQGAIRS